MRHTIVVPFSIRNPVQEMKAYGGLEENRERWFAFRSNLFNRGLMQCLRNQHKPVDQILLLMADDDRSLYERYLDDPMLTPNFGGYHFQTTSELVSRIDSDDLISQHYILNLRKLLQSSSRLTVAAKGYRSDLKSIQSLFAPMSAFLTEPINGPVTVFRDNHVDTWKKHHQQIHSAEWIQLIHGRNIVNAFSAPTTYNYALMGCGNSFAPQTEIDSNWFKEWAGFEMPDPSILDFTV